jgi:DNA helicase-2/ATP-dependent DNA helicase PcrA
MHDFCESRIEEGNEAIYLTDYLSEVSLLTDQDEDKKSEGERITLMTIHAAKGLEFKNVFVAGLEEEIFPSAHSVDSERSLEEERRLLYVAITRAERVCILSYAKSRFRNGQNNFTRPSRFLKDLDPNLLDYPTEASQFSSSTTSTFERETGNYYGGGSRYGVKEENRPWSEKSTSPRSMPSVNKVSMTNTYGKKLTKLPKAEPIPGMPSAPSATSNASGLSAGSYILHERFGKGKICSLEGEGDNAKIDVEFENSGHKKLLLKFAKFTILE